MTIRRTISMALVLFVAGASTLIAPVHAAADARDNEDAANQLIWMINEERSARGIPLVSSRDDVRPMAIDHSGDMARESRLWHNDEYFTEANRTRLHAGLLGENVGRGPTIQSIHDALMASETHRHVLLNSRYAVVGIGVVHSGDRWYITQDFVEPR
jgi:uncharacterized protein YkwD